MDVGRTDEGHGQMFADARNVTCRIETSQLSSVGIAAHVNVHRAESLTGLSIFLFGQQDESGASAKYGQTLENGLTDRVEESQTTQQADLGGRFATRNDERILRLLPVAQLAHLESFHTQFLQHLFVLNECPLQG